MSLEFLIALEIAAICVFVAIFFIFQWIRLGKQFEAEKEDWRQIFLREKKRIKKLRQEIQKLKKNHAAALAEEKQKYVGLSESVNELTQKNAELKSINKKHYEELTDLRKQLKNLDREKRILEEQFATEKSQQSDYEQLYHDLKNSIAYSMSGGEDVLDRLRNRLWENGNIEESKKLAELKERYNSIGESLGIKPEMELFGVDEEQINAEIKQEQEADEQQIEQLENLADDVDSLLADETQFQNVIIDQSSANEKMLAEDIEAARQRIEALEKKLSLSHSQLMQFVDKAKHFQKQKRRLAMYKVSQAQMNQNMMNLSTQHKTLQRQYDSLEAKHKKLMENIGESAISPEMEQQIDQLSSMLTEKEREMECLKMERMLLEQQFVEVANETELLKTTADELERLQKEHQLLENQFLEVMKELETNREQ